MLKGKLANIFGGGELKKEEEIRIEDQKFAEQSNMLMIPKGKKGPGSRKSNISMSDDEEDLDQVFQETMLEEYKKDLKIKSKKAFTPNYDYKTKLQALKELSKKESDLSKDRSYFIINIEHQFIRNHLAIFHMKIVELENTPILMKNQIQGQKKYTVDLELNVNEKNIDDIIKDFCEKQKICTSDEISLTNYVFAIVEAQRIAIESKKLILDIQNFKTDDILQDMKESHLLLLPEEYYKHPKLPDHNENLKRYKDYINKMKDDLELKIYRRLKYKGIPFRIYPRQELYEEIKEKLYANLNNAYILARDEGERVIKHYHNLRTYLDDFAFGKRKVFQPKGGKRNQAVDLLQKKQRELQVPTTDYRRISGSNARPSQMDIKRHTNITVELSPSPDKRGNKRSMLGTPGDPKKLNFHNRNTSNIMANTSTLSIKAGDRKSYMYKSTNEQFDTSTRLGQTMNLGQMSNVNFDSNQVEKEDKKMFIQAKVAQNLDEIIKSYCQS